MGRRELKNKNVRKLMRTGRAGRSIALTLPIELVKALKWRQKQKVVVKKSGKKLIIEDWSR